jgi:NNMT/PNMT/TEMT family protein
MIFETGNRLMPIAGQSSEATAPARNAQFPWDDFAADAYHEHNYDSMREDDAEMLGLVASWFDAAAGGTALRGLDVGAGPNLYPTLAMLPYCSEITLREYSASNVAWLRAATGELDGRWRPFWEVVSPRERYGDFESARARLSGTAKVEQGSVFDLPEAGWDLGTMFFVAESISQDPAEFEAATGAFVRALRPGSPFAAAFMERSQGYEVGGIAFPATSVGESEVSGCLETVATDLKVQRVRVRPAPLRPGYTGYVVAIGRAK